MGRITIFGLADCPHCQRAKAALTERNIPYTEISLSTHPQKKSDMLSLADRLSVPQIFFNETHVGGADDIVALLTKWDEEKLYETPFVRYQAEIESHPDPHDPRLAVPTEPPVTENPPPPRNEAEDGIDVPHEGEGDQKQSVLEATKTLMKIMPRSNLPYHGKVYKNSFKGSDGLEALMKHYKLPNKEEAIRFGRTLQDRKILHHVTNDHDFGDTSYYYRLQPYQQPQILNSFRIWTDRVDPDSASLILRLKKLMGKIESKATDKEGLMDYIAAEEDPNYWIFEEAVCELQKIDMASMDDKSKLTFGINLYNLMIKHAFIKVGTPSTNLQRASFFGHVSYNVGGHLFSFSELENGILRANAVPPYHLQAPFSSSDPRHGLILSKVDPRIHFALNCGAKSCPPVKKFTSAAIEEELRIVAMAFCEQDENVFVDEKKFELKLTMICKWYSKDFAPSVSKLPEKVVEYLRGDKKDKLQKMIDDGSKSVKVKFYDYDWSTNASKSKSFHSDVLKANQVSVKSLIGI